MTTAGAKCVVSQGGVAHDFLKMNGVRTMLLAVIGFVTGGAAFADVVVTAIRVNGQALPARAGSEQVPLRIAPGPRELQFSFENTVPPGGQPVRLRYRLEGLDRAWADVPSHMRMVARFLDAGNQIVAATEFAATRQSPGWHGSVENPEFTPHAGEAVAPPRAVRLQLERAR